MNVSDAAGLPLDEITVTVGYFTGWPALSNTKPLNRAPPSALTAISSSAFART
jgi:hypothetical protein